MNHKNRLYLKMKMRTISSSSAACDFPIPRLKGCILSMCAEAKDIHRFAENVG